MKHFEVVAAVCVDDGLVFCAQRRDSGETAKKWEFPGGKIEHGESQEDALIREFREEFHTDIVPERYLATVHHQYRSYSITMHAHIARISGPVPTLTEHLAARWLSIDQLDTLDWAPADIPIVERVKKEVSKRATLPFA